MVVLLVDALGWSLASRTPGFAAMLEHRRELATVLGFSSGALPTLFTGRLPEEHGRFLMYRRANGSTPFSGFGATGLLPGRVQKSWRLTRTLTRLVKARGVHGYFNLYDVPRRLLPEFDLPERRDPFAAKGLPGGALWDTLDRRNLPWRGWNWRTPETENLAALEQRVREGDEAFLFCYTADLDHQQHVEGPSGAGVAACMTRYHEAIARIERAARERGQTVWIYLLSDHGMVAVTRCVDVMGELARLPLAWPRDYLPFFDSTFARFWWRAPEARERVRAALAATGWGRWLDDDRLAREGARFPGREYGDDLFLLDPGVLMVPSFMGDRPLAAMHGYDPAHPDMTALLWSNRPIPEGVRHLKQVRGFLESELDAREAAA
jgi:hypothetical protein